MRALLFAVLLLASLACAPSKPPTTSLRLTPAADAPKRAKVTVDDQPLGSLEFVLKHGVALPPGKHRMSIEAEGYLPYDVEIEAGDNGGVIKLDVKLIKTPD